MLSGKTLPGTGNSDPSKRHWWDSCCSPPSPPAPFRPHWLRERPGLHWEDLRAGPVVVTVPQAWPQPPALSQQLPCLITNLTRQVKASSASLYPPPPRLPLLRSSGLSSASPTLDSLQTHLTSLPHSRAAFPNSLELRVETPQAQTETAIPKRTCPAPLFPGIRPLFL